MNTRIVPFTEKELENKAPIFSKIFYGVEIEKVMMLGRAINLMGRQNLIPRVFLEETQCLEKCLLIACYGEKLGFEMIESFNNLYIVNNKISLHSNGGRILMLRSGLVVQNSLEWDEEKQSATRTVRRKGIEYPAISTFSLSDAKVAGLLGRNVWKKYPKPMCGYRASWPAWNELFSDIFHGVASKEEQEDIRYTTYEGNSIPLNNIKYEDHPLLSGISNVELMASNKFPSNKEEVKNEN